MFLTGEGLTLPGLDDGALDVAEVSGDVANEVLLLGVIEDLLPERARLLEVNCNGVRQQELKHIRRPDAHAR